MIKNCVSLDIKKNDKNYKFLLDCDSPLGEVYDALTEMRHCIYLKLKEYQEQEANLPKTQPGVENDGTNE